jgi:hypothetical protein
VVLSSRCGRLVSDGEQASTGLLAVLAKAGSAHAVPPHVPEGFRQLGNVTGDQHVALTGLQTTHGSGRSDTLWNRDQIY